ncbi:hypothetical protein [Paenibacillus andongensis]|uniref:hypothetical protein n=1 Tax=Paenibacillus andongensis TaxID=2975482 RepID=UPI0021BADD82|nr:hypothetical protein [Paenibacillus andongensis]
MSFARIYSLKVKFEFGRYYNGYSFYVDAAKRIYNPDRVLYFFNGIQRKFPHPLQVAG